MGTELHIAVSDAIKIGAVAGILAGFVYGSGLVVLWGFMRAIVRLGIIANLRRGIEIAQLTCRGGGGKSEEEIRDNIAAIRRWIAAAELHRDMLLYGIGARRKGISWIIRAGRIGVGRDLLTREVLGANREFDLALEWYYRAGSNSKTDTTVRTANAALKEMGVKIA